MKTNLCPIALFYTAIALILTACGAPAPTAAPVTSAPVVPKSPPTATGVVPTSRPGPTLVANEAPTGPSNPFAGNKAWIAYQTDRGGGGVWLIHPDGSEDHQIAKDFTGNLLLPDWSPDGTKLVMASRETGGTEPLYEYDLATETYRQLFDCEDPCVGDDEPVYSSDGTKVAFIRALAPFVHSDIEGDDVPSNCGLWIGDIASGEVTQVTGSNQPCDRREIAPHWSRDGSAIAYFRRLYDSSGVTTAIFVMDADGGEEQQLTDWSLIAGYPEWSPDGEWIVFATHPLFAFNFDSVVSNLYRMHPDGSQMEQLTSYETADIRANQPSYTPDGKWIIFTSVTPSSRSLWVLPAKGGEPIVIAQGRNLHTWRLATLGPNVVAITAAKPRILCVDIRPVLKGPNFDKPQDVNTPDAMQAVADALLSIGLDELR